MTELEFIAKLLDLKSEVTVSAIDDPETVTREMPTIELWKSQGKELLFHGIRLKSE